jgi:hypothetical protein
MRSYGLRALFLGLVCVATAYGQVGITPGVGLPPVNVGPMGLGPTQIRIGPMPSFQPPTLRTDVTLPRVPDLRAAPPIQSAPPVSGPGGGFSSYPRADRDDPAPPDQSVTLPPTPPPPLPPPSLGSPSSGNGPPPPPPGQIARPGVPVQDKSGDSHWFLYVLAALFFLYVCWPAKRR